MVVVEPLLNYLRTFNELTRECFTAAFQKAEHTIYTLQKTVGKFNKISSKNFLFKFNNRNNRTRHEICQKLTIKTPDWSKLGIDFTYWFCVFIVDFEQLIWTVSGFFLMLLLLILNRYFFILVVVFLTDKCRKSFSNCRKLLSIEVNVQNVSFGECWSDWFSLPG